MCAVGEIENPQHGHIRCRGIFVSPDRPIEPTFSKLRLTFWQRVDVDGVILQDINGLGDDPIGFSEMIRLNEIQIVRRRVILRNFSELTALEKSNRQIKSWRTILAFVVAIGAEIENRRRQSRMAQNVDNRPVDLGISVPAFLVCGATAITDH